MPPTPTSGASATSPKATTSSIPTFHRGYALLEKYAMSYDLDATPETMTKARDLARKFPGIDLILDHAGFPQERTAEYFEFWTTGMKTMAEAPNTRVQDLRSRDGRPALDGRLAASVGARMHRGVRRRSLHVRHQLAGRPPVLELRRPRRGLPRRSSPTSPPTSSASCSSATPGAGTASHDRGLINTAESDAMNPTTERLSASEERPHAACVAGNAENRHRRHRVVGDPGPPAGADERMTGPR